MNKLMNAGLLAALLVLASFLIGCNNAGGTATQEDKKNIERLAKEGVGAPTAEQEAE